MGKGYAEGPAAEERLAELERSEHADAAPEPPTRQAVYGATADDPAKTLPRGGPNHVGPVCTTPLGVIECACSRW